MVPQSSFLAGALRRRARPLRIAVASKLPPSPLTRLHPENRAAFEETVELLRWLGHEVSEREIDHGPLSPPLEFTALYLRSLHEEAAALASPRAPGTANPRARPPRGHAARRRWSTGR